MEREDIAASLIEEGEEAGWIVTFADLMSLLLVFFVLLYSISSLNVEKFKVALQSIQVGLGGDNMGAGLIELIEIPDDLDTRISLEELTGLRSRENAMVNKINDFISQEKLGDHVLVQIYEGKIIIQVRGKVLFSSGSAILNREASPILEKIADIIGEYGEYNVNIKGHTDNIPIRTALFPSNWELSAIRATNVLKFLIDRKIHPIRLTATGYGDVLPLVPNDSIKNRAINRRVEFVLEKKAE